MKPFPSYLRSGLLPLREQRWQAIARERWSEFSFNGRQFPFQEPPDPVDADSSLWRDVPDGLQGEFGSVDFRYPRGAPPAETAGQRIKLSGWRGERLYVQLLLWSAGEVKQVRWRLSPFTGSGGELAGEDALKVNFIRYVLTDDGSQGGRGAPPDSVFLSADVLDDIERFDLPARSLRPLWITVNVPPAAAPGIYRAEIAVEAAGNESISFSL
ncbi:MAG TPA: hypothetical protein VJ417_14570, partial [Candidatus Glassbacteria bacterium]|nr:hypothetical protein [Candidatus Glassbacteria bacterium]